MKPSSREKLVRTRKLNMKVNDEMSYIPTKLINFSVHQKQDSQFLPTYPFKPALSHDFDSIVRKKGSEPNPLSNKTPISPIITSKSSNMNSVKLTKDLILTDRRHTRLEFYKKPTDVSYLMETQGFGTDRSLNDYFTRTITRSTNLLSPQRQASFLNKTMTKFREKQENENQSKEASKGNEYKLNELKLPLNLDKLKNFMTLDTESEEELPSKDSYIKASNNIHALSTKSPRKIVDSVTVGYGINEYLETKESDVKEGIKKVIDKEIVQHRSQNKKLILPSGRKEVIVLSDWLNQMLEKMYKEETIKTDKAFENVQLIYTVCLQELIKQVKAQCSERGQLLDKIWEAYIDLFDRVIQEHNKAVREMEKYYLEEMEQIQKVYRIRLERTILELENVKKQRDETSALLETKKDEIRFLKKKTQRLDAELTSQKCHAGDLALEMARIKAENSELKKLALETGPQILNQYQEAQNILNLKFESKKAARKLKKGQILQDLFDPLRDKLLYENLNLIDELENELAGRDLTEDNEDEDDENQVDEENDGDICKHVGVDTRDLVETAEFEVQIGIETQDNETQWENFAQQESATLEEQQQDQQNDIQIDEAKEEENKNQEQEQEQEQEEKDNQQNEIEEAKERKENIVEDELDKVQMFEILHEIDKKLSKKLRQEKDKEMKSQLAHLLMTLLKAKVKLNPEDYEKLITNMLEKNNTDFVEMDNLKNQIFQEINKEPNKEGLLQILERVYAKIPKLSGLGQELDEQTNSSFDEIVGLAINILRGNDANNLKKESLKALLLKALKPTDKESGLLGDINLPFVDVIDEVVAESIKDVQTESMSKKDILEFIEYAKKALDNLDNDENSPKVDRELIQMLAMIIGGSKHVTPKHYRSLLKKTLRSLSQSLEHVTSLRVENEEHTINIQELNEIKEKYERRIEKLEMELMACKNKVEHSEKQCEKLNSKLLKLKTNAEEIKHSNLQKLKTVVQTMNKFKNAARASSYVSPSKPLDEALGEEEKPLQNRISITISNYDKVDGETGVENLGTEIPKENTDYIDDHLTEHIANLISEEPDKELEEDDETWSENEDTRENDGKLKLEGGNIDALLSSIQDANKVLSSRRTRSKRSGTITKPQPGVNSQTAKMLRVLSVNADSANALLMRVKAKKNIKSGLPKLTILKFIAQIYTDRLKAPPATRKIPLYIVAYDSFMHKYGLKKVAENKCQQMFESVFLYPENLRIQRFKDFLGLGESYDSDELELYFSTMKAVDPSGNGSSIVVNLNERTLILMENAEQAATNLFGQKLDPQAFKSITANLSQFKMNDNKNNKPVIEFEDVFNEFLVVQRHLEDKVKRFVKDIFNAADLNNDEIIAFSEFDVLCKHLEKERYEKEEVKKLFFENADMILPEEESNERVMSFNRFAKICLEMGLFSEAKQEIFAEVSDPEDKIQNVKQLEDNLKAKLNAIRLRFIKSNAYNIQLKGIMTKLYNSIRNPLKSRNVVWLSYRLLDEESKYQLLNYQIKQMLPKELLAICDFVENFEEWNI